MEPKGSVRVPSETRARSAPFAGSPEVVPLALTLATLAACVSRESASVKRMVPDAVSLVVEPVVFASSAIAPLALVPFAIRGTSSVPVMVIVTFCVTFPPLPSPTCTA